MLHERSHGACPLVKLVGCSGIVRGMDSPFVGILWFLVSYWAYTLNELRKHRIEKL